MIICKHISSRVYALVCSFVFSALFASSIYAEQADNNAIDLKDPDNATLHQPGYVHPPHHVRFTSNIAPSATQLSPAQVTNAYGMNLIANKGAGIIIGIVTAFDHPTIQSDLNVFSRAFGLRACTVANGCFAKIYASGTKPATSGNWALETSLDVEWAHAIAPNARILLVEAANNNLNNMFQAVNVAKQRGASVISMSWGTSDFPSETNFDAIFNSAGITFIAASGDGGNGTSYPATSRFVIAVGGTTLFTNANGDYQGEVAWAGSGGGLSPYEPEPNYQRNYPIPNDPTAKRGNPDVAYDANPNTGFMVYDSVPFQGQKGWFIVGGTSAGAPQWAGIMALVNSQRRALGKPNISSAFAKMYSVVGAPSVYRFNFHDITSGKNGNCGYYCNARVGYDYVTGLGSPVAQRVINTLTNTA